MDKPKNEAARALVNIRWSKTSDEERKRHASMMGLKSGIARRARSKKYQRIEEEVKFKLN